MDEGVRLGRGEPCAGCALGVGVDVGSSSRWVLWLPALLPLSGTT